MKQKINILLILGFIIFSFCLVSCSNDDDDNDTSFLIGYWDECYANGDLRNNETEIEVFHLFFDSNGKGTWHSSDEGKIKSAKSFTWKVSGDMMTLIYTNGDNETAKFSYHDGILFFIGGDVYYKKRK